MILRQELVRRIQDALDRSRVVGLFGPRQCGKTTVAREILEAASPNYFDLEDPRHVRQLEQPMTALESLTGVVVLDEVQRVPELFPVLRVLADRVPLPAKFLVLGSASPALLKQTSESLAGRIAPISMSGFSLTEAGPKNQGRLWLRGGYPLAYLARDDQHSAAWRKDFIQTFLERDVPQFGFSIPASTLGRFWAMTAHYHGQVWNTAELARSLAIGETSVRRYLDLLTDLFMIRQLPPWHASLKKRQVRSPKLYFRDTGLLHSLLGIHTEQELLHHPKSGASWEGFVIEQILTAVDPDEAYFWATHQGAEIDLILVRDGRLLGVECKRADAPGMTPSIRNALDDLQLERIAVVYPGHRRYAIANNVEAVPLAAIVEGLPGLFPEFQS